MKKTKKLLAMILSIAVFVLAAIPVSATQEEISNYEFLLSQGYSASVLNGLAEETMSRMVALIGNNSVLDITTEETTYSQNTGLTKGIIDEDAMTLQITSGTIGPSNSNVVNGVLVVVSWEWAKNKPTYRGKDALAINWDSDLFIFETGSFSACDLYKSNAGDNWSVFKDSNTTSDMQQGGLGYYTDLKGLVEYVGGNMAFMLEPKEAIYKGNTYGSNINVKYAHEYMPFTGLGFSYGAGFDLSWDRGCDTTASSSTVRFSR